MASNFSIISAGRIPRLPVIVLTAFGTVQTAVDAMKAGRQRFSCQTVFPSSSRRSSEQARGDCRSEPPGSQPSVWICEIITQNAAMLSLLEQAAQAAKTQATVLVQAESGTGKELLARWIHKQQRESQRAVRRRELRRASR